MSTPGPSNEHSQSTRRDAGDDRLSEHPESASEGSEVGQGGDSAATYFRKKVSGKQATLDDYDPEEELWRGGYSGKAMIGTWLGLILITIGLIAAAILIPDFSIAIALLIALVFWAIGLLMYGYRRLGIRYQLTTQRFIHQAGVLTRRTDRIEVIDIDDVSYSQGPVQRALGVGRILITSSDRSHPELTMVGIHDVANVAGLIDDIRRKERRKRSLHIEQI